MFYYQLMFLLKAQCDGREGRESSYGRRRKRRQVKNFDKNDESVETFLQTNTDKREQDLSLKEMFRVYENRDEISIGNCKHF